MLEKAREREQPVLPDAAGSGTTPRADGSPAPQRALRTCHRQHHHSASRDDKAGQVQLTLVPGGTLASAAAGKE